MYTKTYYNTERDIKPTQPNMSIKLNRSFEDLVIKDTGTEPFHNGITNPNDVIGRCKNVFDVINVQRGIAKTVMSSESSEE